MSPGVALGYQMLGRNAVEVAAHGATVRLSDGRDLVDFGSYAVTLLGHRPDAVVTAVKEQLQTMPTATRALANPVVAQFANELQSRCDDDLDRVWIGSSGADAVEAATKLARRSTGRMRILAAEGAFHGKTLGALALTHGKSYRRGLEPLLGHVTHLATSDADAVARETSLDDVAALILEPIQGEGGVRFPPPDVVTRWVSDAHSARVPVISDEIQIGLGRCGEFSRALASDWQPDAILFGKALGGGVLPLSAVVATSDLYAPLLSDPTWHTSTFGGHPLACAAGIATLRLIDELGPAAAEVSRAVAEGLSELAQRHCGVIAEIRGEGLIWGIDFASEAVAGGAFAELANNGLLVSPCLGSPQTIRLLPPMVATPNDIDRALAALDLACLEARHYLDPVGS